MQTTSTTPGEPTPSTLPACSACGSAKTTPATMRHRVEMEYDGLLYRVPFDTHPALRCRSCRRVTPCELSQAQRDAALRNHLTLLTPEKIRANRRILRLKPRQMCSLLGCTEQMLAAWESGEALQPLMCDRLLRAFFGCPELRHFLAHIREEPRLGGSVCSKQAIDQALHLVGKPPPLPSHPHGLRLTS